MLRFCTIEFIFFHNYQYRDCERRFRKVQSLFQSSRTGEVYQHFQAISKSQPFYIWTRAAVSSDQDYSSYPPPQTNNDDTDSYHASSFPKLNSAFAHYIRRAASTIKAKTKCVKEGQ